MPAKTTSFSAEHLRHAGGGLLVLLVTTVLAVYKPWGKSRYGWRKQHQQRTAPVSELGRPPTRRCSEIHDLAVRFSREPQVEVMHSWDM